MKWLELRRLEIAQFIDAMVTGAEAQRKPAPDGIIKCLEALEQTLKKDASSERISRRMSAL